ncbi:MAG: NAD(P)/FAD-dependent oxidoreductase [Chryseolinea sp.]
MAQGEVVIVGSGLGGLACGVILAKEGFHVTVLEKNNQIGGMLQTFTRDKVIFDTGIHYVGGLDKGQTLYRIFSYLGIMEKLKLRKMDNDFFDGVAIGHDPVIYKYAQGYDNFIRVMTSYFPEEVDAINSYCDKIISICLKFPVYNLASGGYTDADLSNTTDTQAYLESITSNQKLITVLAGTSLLYAGEPNKTPLHVHALIINHYIESSWKFINGGGQIARLLSREITSRGGRILKHIHVKELQESGGKIVYAQCHKGEKYYGDVFISNAHPIKTLEMVNSDLIRNAYRSRLESLDNTVSVFYVNVVLKKDTVKYQNHNLYVLAQNNPWCAINYTSENWPQGYAVFYNAVSRETEYTDGVTIMAYMRFDDVKEWGDTYNTVDFESSRGDAYETFKAEKAEKLFKAVENRLPGFRGAIRSYTAATPLTARDYIGTGDGSLYGFAKDYRNPLKTMLSPKTKIPNLFLTGQNVNLHGVLGVSLSSIVTCGQVLGTDYIIDKIRNA